MQECNIIFLECFVIANKLCYDLVDALFSAVRAAAGLDHNDATELVSRVCLCKLFHEMCIGGHVCKDVPQTVYIKANVFLFCTLNNGLRECN